MPQCYGFEDPWIDAGENSGGEDAMNRRECNQLKTIISIDGDLLWYLEKEKYAGFRY